MAVRRMPRAGRVAILVNQQAVGSARDLVSKYKTESKRERHQGQLLSSTCVNVYKTHIHAHIYIAHSRLRTHNYSLMHTISLRVVKIE